MNSMVIFQQLLILFGLMALGFFGCKKGWMDETASRKVSALVVNLFNPMIQLSGAVSRSESTTGAMVGQNLILCCLLFVLAVGLSFPLVRLMGIPREKRGVYQNMLMFCNFGFMGIPIVTGLYGASHVIFVTFYMLFMNTLFYTVGMTLITGSFSLKKVMNIGTFACIASMLVFALNLRVPSYVASFLSYGGNTCIPLSMMVIGANLARSQLKELFAQPRYYIFMAVKMLALPIAMVLVARNLPFDRDLLGIYMVMAAMPCASLPALVAQERCSPELGREASQINTLTTVVSLVTVPIVAMFL